MTFSSSNSSFTYVSISAVSRKVNNLRLPWNSENERFRFSLYLHRNTKSVRNLIVTGPHESPYLQGWEWICTLQRKIPPPFIGRVPLVTLARLHLDFGSDTLWGQVGRNVTRFPTRHSPSTFEVKIVYPKYSDDRRGPQFPEIQLNSPGWWL